MKSLARIPLLLFLLGGTLLTSGCAIGRRWTNLPIDPAKVAQLEPGKTTAAEVVELFGGPVEVVQLGRRTAYRYEGTQTKISGIVLVIVGTFNTDTRSDFLWVFFDENDVLTHAGATYAADDAEWAMPWTDVHD